MINATKCSQSDAEDILDEMEDLGLGLEQSPGNEFQGYDLLSFAKLRGYLDSKELEKIRKQLEKKASQSKLYKK